MDVRCPKTIFSRSRKMNNVRPFNLYTSKKFTTFLDCIDQISDPRLNRCKRHPLINILVVIIFSILGGADNPSEIERFGKRHIKWFASVLALNHGIPSHDTVGRALDFINPHELGFWLTLWAEETIQNDDPKHIAIDGKEDNANHFYCMRAFDVKGNWVMAHARIPTENNEITIAPQLLDKLPLKGSIITGDAILTQRKIVRRIVNGGGDYLFALKRNQHQFYDDVKLYLDDIENNELLVGTFTKSTTSEKGHGRIETRTCITTDKIEWLPQIKRWGKLATISVVERTRTIKNKTTRTRAYFISSLKYDSVAISQLVRDHWSIENLCHRELDMNFESDHSTIRGRHAALNMSIIKDFTLGLLRNSRPELSLKEKRIQNDHQFTVLLKTLLNKAF